MICSSQPEVKLHLGQRWICSDTALFELSLIFRLWRFCVALFEKCYTNKQTVLRHVAIISSVFPPFFFNTSTCVFPFLNSLTHTYLCLNIYRHFPCLLRSCLPPWVIVVFGVRQERQSLQPPQCVPAKLQPMYASFFSGQIASNIYGKPPRLQQTLHPHSCQRKSSV